MNDAFCVAVSQPWAAGQVHQTQFVTLPSGCVSVRGTVTPSAAARSDPRLACSVQLMFRGLDNVQIPGSAAGLPARESFAEDELTPVSGHEQGRAPGELPPGGGGFVFVVRDSPGVQQGAYRASVAVQFAISLGDSATVSAGITIEAFGVDEQPLEIA